MLADSFGKRPYSSFLLSDTDGSLKWATNSLCLFSCLLKTITFPTEKSLYQNAMAGSPGNGKRLMIERSRARLRIPALDTTYNLSQLIPVNLYLSDLIVGLCRVKNHIAYCKLRFESRGFGGNFIILSWELSV